MQTNLYKKVTKSLMIINLKQKQRNYYVHVEVLFVKED